VNRDGARILARDRPGGCQPTSRLFSTRFERVAKSSSRSGGGPSPSWYRPIVNAARPCRTWRRSVARCRSSTPRCPPRPQGTAPIVS